MYKERVFVTQSHQSGTSFYTMLLHLNENYKRKVGTASSTQKIWMTTFLCFINSSLKLTLNWSLKGGKIFNGSKRGVLFVALWHTYFSCNDNHKWVSVCVQHMCCAGVRQENDVHTANIKCSNIEFPLSVAGTCGFSEFSLSCYIYTSRHLVAVLCVYKRGNRTHRHTTAYHVVLLIVIRIIAGAHKKEHCTICTLIPPSLYKWTAHIGRRYKH